MAKKLLERIVVTLFELGESGSSVRNDSPVIGATATYGHWSKIHGYYASKKDSEIEKKRLIKERVKEGFRRIAGEDGLMKSDKERLIYVKPLEVDKKQISQRNGDSYYNRKKIK